MLKTKDCPIDGCETRVYLDFLMCSVHWRRVPAETQVAVNTNWQNWRSTSDPHEKAAAAQAWLKASRAALAAVNKQVTHGTVG